MANGIENVSRGVSRTDGRNRVSDSAAVQNLPKGRLIPGFLIVQKNGVVRMNPNYKGEM